MPNSSSPTTNGKLLRNSTCLVYAPGPLVAKELETKCSTRNKPIGTIPLRECSRRSRNECPFPARSGATPLFTRTGSELVVDDTKVPSGIRDQERTCHYVCAREGKSNDRKRKTQEALVRWCFHFAQHHAAIHAIHEFFLLGRHRTIFTQAHRVERAMEDFFSLGTS